MPASDSERRLSPTAAKAQKEPRATDAAADTSDCSAELSPFMCHKNSQPPTLQDKPRAKCNHLDRDMLLA